MKLLYKYNEIFLKKMDLQMNFFYSCLFTNVKLKCARTWYGVVPNFFKIKKRQTIDSPLFCTSYN